MQSLWAFKTDDEPDEKGHQWERVYFNDTLVGMRCTICKFEPIELLEREGGLSACRGTLGAIMKGFTGR